MTRVPSALTALAEKMPFSTSRKRVRSPGPSWAAYTVGFPSVRTTATSKAVDEAATW
jgi:hypothetical protein